MNEVSLYCKDCFHTAHLGVNDLPPQPSRLITPKRTKTGVTTELCRIAMAVPPYLIELSTGTDSPTLHFTGGIALRAVPTGSLISSQGLSRQTPSPWVD